MCSFSFYWYFFQTGMSRNEFALSLARKRITMALKSTTIVSWSLGTPVFQRRGPSWLIIQRAFSILPLIDVRSLEFRAIFWQNSTALSPLPNTTRKIVHTCMSRNFVCAVLESSKDYITYKLNLFTKQRKARKPNFPVSLNTTFPACFPGNFSS